jgi:iron(III) transport system ATP-binding protein
MHQGRLEQIGTPEEVYGQPTSRFVAEFVTQANFLPARLGSGGWETEVGCFVVPGAAAATADLMIRQEDMVLVAEAGGPVVVRDRQFLGREYQYCLETPTGRRLYARRPTSEGIAVGCRVRIQVSPQRVQLYPIEAQSTASSPSPLSATPAR